MKGFPDIPTRKEVAKDFKAGGGSIAAVLPIHYPRALLRSFHFLPMEVWGPPGVDSTFGEAHLQPYICSIARNALSFIQMDAFQMVDLILVPHACDSLQGLGSILLDFVRPKQGVLPLYLPRDNGKNGIHFLAAEFMALFRRLEDLTATSPTHAALMEAIYREEQADQTLLQLHQQRSTLGLSDYELYRVIRAREFLPAEGFVEITRQVLDRGKHETSGEIPIVLSGILPEPMALFHAIAEAGGRIVADDLACCGRRLYPPGKSSDPFLRMAESILHAPPDWSRGSPIQNRLEEIIEKSRTYGAKGVIFYNIKFCEPELFDLPGLREGLKKLGIPSTVIEVDINDPVSNQVQTRVEAFLEMIA
jgi:benzoyl-CoA reductase/2-hydroxyglutaryl-CoA dehydratase subunit BcrC/BadD/HgdB